MRRLPVRRDCESYQAGPDRCSSTSARGVGDIDPLRVSRAVPSTRAAMNKGPIETSESLFLDVVLLASIRVESAESRFGSCRDSSEGSAVGGAAAGQLEAKADDFGPRVGQFAALEVVGLVDAEVAEFLADQEGSDVGRARVA
jgi:hypothetical protein